MQRYLWAKENYYQENPDARWLDEDEIRKAEEKFYREKIFKQKYPELYARLNSFLKGSLQ